jgi:hypothetical protein
MAHLHVQQRAAIWQVLCVALRKSIRCGFLYISARVTLPRRQKRASSFYHSREILVGRTTAAPLRCVGHSHHSSCLSSTEFGNRQVPQKTLSLIEVTKIPHTILVGSKATNSGGKRQGHRSNKTEPSRMVQSTARAASAARCLHRGTSMG